MSFFKVQVKNTLYAGTYDAFRKIIAIEGVRGLYKGFIPYSFSIIAQQWYSIFHVLLLVALLHYILNLFNLIWESGSA